MFDSRLLWSCKSRYRRRGSVYVLAISTAMLLAVIGFSAITLARINIRTTTDANNWLEAGFLAFFAVEHALHTINNTPGWRTGVPQGSDLTSPEATLGGGTASFVIRDEDDGDIADDPSGPLCVYGIGRVGDAVRVHSVLVQPDHGLDVLRTAIHSTTELQVKGGNELIATGGPVSCNGDIDNDEIIYGDVVSLTVSDPGVVTGETTQVAPRTMPGTDVLDRYRNLATQIPFSGNIVSQVLSPGENPWGAGNEDGLYYIDTLGNDIEIQGCRIHGTLIVRCPGKKLCLKDAVFIEPYRAEYPALIVDGEVELKLKSEAMELSEAAWGRNFNPPGTPYQDETDLDTQDSYPNEVRGLVHVFGLLGAWETTRIKGVILCHNKITIENSLHIIYDEDIYENPPLGYADPNSPLAIIPNTWLWDAVPNP